MAADLRAHIATKAPKAPVFNLPHETNLARMLRDDLAEARKQWVKASIDDPQEYAQRKESDFLTDVNHAGELIDFHSLRHTCGGWLATTGTYPKVVQQVMRHQSITLTMDTYGHLFPGQEADAVGRMRAMLVDLPEALRATGTDDAAAVSPETAQHLAQQLERETRRSDAKGYDKRKESVSTKKSPKPLQIADLGDGVRSDATENESRPGGTRTPDQGIMSPDQNVANTEENFMSPPAW